MFYIWIKLWVGIGGGGKNLLVEFYLEYLELVSIYYKEEYFGRKFDDKCYFLCVFLVKF